MVDSQLGHTLADWSHVTRISFSQAIEPRLHARSRPEIAQLVKPAGKDGCLPQFNHPFNVAEWLHRVKAYCNFGDDVTPNDQGERPLGHLEGEREATCPRVRSTAGLGVTSAAQA